MTRILYICPSSGIGGAETFLKGTWRWQDPTQFANHYLAFTDGPLVSELRALGAPVTLLGFSPRLSHLRSRQQVTDQVMALIKKHQIDLVHSTMAYGAIFAAWACWRSRTKHIWFQHGPASGWMDQVAAALPHHGVIANSQFTLQRQQQLERPIAWLLSRKRKFFRLTLGTELPELSTLLVDNFRQQIISQHQIPANAILVSMLCRLQEWKGVHVFLAALKEVQTTNKNIVGLIYGEPFKGDHYLQKLKQFVSDHKLKVIFMGATPEPQLALAASDILVNASIQPEPFGLSIIEAMAVGTPVIAPNEGGPQEIIEHNKTGFLFAARNSSDLAHHIVELAQPHKMTAMAAECKNQVRLRFNAQTTYRNLENLYLQILQNGSLV